MKMRDFYEESSTNSREEEEEKEEEETKKLSVKVKWIKSNNNEEEEEEDDEEVEDVTFKIDDNIPLRWLMVRYCDKIRVTYGDTRFQFNGVRLRETDTPRQLSMISFDVIYAFPYQYFHGRSAVPYTTLCIRMHNARDTFLRVRPTAPLLPQLKRGLSDGGPHEEASLYFVYAGSKLTGNDIANDFEMQDGDIIDAFNFEESSSSLSIVDPQLRFTLKVVCENYKDNIFTVKQSTRLSLLVRKYRQLHSLSCGIHLLHKGRRLIESHTMEEARLEDGDVIHARLLI